MYTTGETVGEVRTMEAIQKMARDISGIKENTPTLRDQFAMSVMPILSDKYSIEYLAIAAYKVADAMLAARGN